MRQKFYNSFIKPISKDSDQAEREIVLNYLLVGILALSVVSFLVTLLAPIFSREPAFIGRLLNNLITALFIVGLYFVARYKYRHKLVAILLTLLVALFGCFIALQWGILDPYSALLLSLAVVMAGILVNARYSLYMAAALAVVLSFLQHTQAAGSLKPDVSWMEVQPALGDAIAFAAILLVIALVSWLFNRQMEMSLKRARRSEKALQRERDLLEIKVEKRARQLEEAQLEKMQQLYRFAELGQLSTALFHDLANHLSNVNLDIAVLPSAGDPDITSRIQQNVGHINDIVRRVRQQIGGKNSAEAIDVQEEIEEVIKILSPKAEQAKVAIQKSTDKSVGPHLLCKGDVVRFRQIILNLINNAIEAYGDKKGKETAGQTVLVSLKRQGTMLFISVSDHGPGVRPANRAKIFEPFFTTKRRGIGIGLFMVKQIVESDFGGSIEMSASEPRGATFSISLPKSYYGKIKASRN